jgi:hypothetical protein
MKAWLGMAALAFLGATASADTWYVDDDGGPGVDFTSIGEAIVAAAPGDLILVQAGLYPSFFLDKALTLLGQPGPSGPAVKVTGNTWVSGIQVGGVALIADMDLGWTNASQCAGTVVFVGVEALGIGCGSAADVRVHQSLTEQQLSAGSARVQVTQSGLKGADGTPGDNGSPAVNVYTGGRAHIYHCTVLGGDGGPDGGGSFAWGAPAIRATQNGRLLLGGDLIDVCQGGNGMYQENALWLEGTSVGRVSHVALQGFTITPPATIEQPFPHDPALGVLSWPAPGQPVTFQLTAPSASSAELLLGRKPVVPLDSGSAEVLGIATLRVFAMPDVGASGKSYFDFVVPPTAPDGFLFFAQARVTLPDGEQRYTNSLPILVR